MQRSHVRFKRRYLHWTLLSLVLIGFLFGTPIGIRLSRIATVELRRAQWFVMRPTDYRYQVIGMRGLLFDPGCASVTVTNNTISHIEACEPKRFDPSLVALTETTVSISYLFAVIRRALAENAETIDIDYDPWLGYPRVITIDGERRIDFDEAIYSINDFTIVP